MRQGGLIDKVISQMRLDDGASKVKWTPAKAKPLVKDEDVLDTSGQFSYSSVVGMMLYLAGHTCPDITYVVKCCAPYIFCSRIYHELALKRMSQHLEGSRNNGLIPNPSKEFCEID